MKALAIVTLVLSALSISIPTGGVFLTRLFSALAVLSLRSPPTLSGVVSGQGISNAARLSPRLMLAEASHAKSAAYRVPNAVVVVLLVRCAFFAAAIMWRLVTGPVAPKTAAVSHPIAEPH